MAYDIHKNYLVYFQDQLIGTFNKSHYGLGWISGFHFQAAPHFAAVKDFCEAYRNFVDQSGNLYTLEDIKHEDYGSLPEFIKCRDEIESLASLFAREFLYLKNWKITETTNPDLALNTTIPVISETTIQWKGVL